MSIRIAIFDDNKNIRNSIILLLNTDPEFEVVGSYSNADDCVSKVISAKPDVILMDLEMPGFKGVDAVRLLSVEFPHIQILIQTIFDDDQRIFDSISAGASGYLIKNQINSSLTSAIKDLRAGGGHMSPMIARKVMIMLQHGYKNNKASEEYNLTTREKEVLTAVVNGLSYKMISYELDISYDTVRSHIKRIYEKLHVGSITEVVIKAINQKIV